MIFFSIFSLPGKKFSYNNKRFIFLFLLPIISTDLFFFQYNNTVAYIFIFAFGYFERGKYFEAITLILFSGFTKIYGLIQLGFLIFYPKFWKNIIYVIIVSTIFFLIPVIKIPINDLIEYYCSWFGALSERHDPIQFETIFSLLSFLGYKSVNNYIHIIQIGTLLIICFLTLFSWKSFKNSVFRTEILGIIMSWIILFSTAAEAHTYIIALLGYLLWYLQQKITRFDIILLWSNFFLLTIVPIDILCPVQVREFLHSQLHLNLSIFLITWLRMVFITFKRSMFSAASNA